MSRKYPQLEAKCRDKWHKKIEFILACTGYAVGLGNVWRFPYLCFESGGGAFLIPYFVMLILCGIPLLYMELAVGQFIRQGPVGSLRMLCPLLKGVGYGTVIISFIMCTYYIVILAWAVYYFIASFSTVLPWSQCGQWWNTVDCAVSGDLNLTNTSVTASQEFYKHRVLRMTDDITDPGAGVVWPLLGLLFLVWVLVYFCICRGVRSTGKVVYVTVPFPYIVLFILLVYASMLPGARDGVLFFIKPRFSEILQAKVWIAAAAQNFNSIGIAFGGLIAYSSYNRFNNNIIRDVVSVAIVNAFTSILAGFTIFSILGHLAFVYGKAIPDVVASGVGLVFEVYPNIVSLMSPAQLWSTIFFLMLIMLGVDSQFGFVEVIVTSVQDEAPRLVKTLKRKEIVVLIVCCLCFIAGIPYILENGMYIFTLVDWYTAAVSLMVLSFFEVIAITWFYGAHRLSRNIAQMNGSQPNIFFKACWFVVSPLLILVILLYTVIDYKVVTLGSYTYPGWAQYVGWMIASLSVIPIPIGAVHTLITAPGDTWNEKLRHCITPQVLAEESDDSAYKTEIRFLDMAPPDKPETEQSAA